LRYERLIAFGVAMTGHRSLEVDRAHDVGEQKCLELGHIGRYSSPRDGPARCGENDE
jgi:hypothetical protein